MNKIVKEWVTGAGLKAVILFVADSHHCGYVELPENLINKNFTGYDGEGALVDISVHGGVTYQGEIHNMEVIGFDCAHIMDKTKYSRGGEFRDEAFCIKECESMAKQMIALANK